MKAMLDKQTLITEGTEGIGSIRIVPAGIVVTYTTIPDDVRRGARTFYPWHVVTWLSGERVDLMAKTPGEVTEHPEWAHELDGIYEP